MDTLSIVAGFIGFAIGLFMAFALVLLTKKGVNNYVSITNININHIFITICWVVEAKHSTKR